MESFASSMSWSTITYCNEDEKIISEVVTAESFHIELSPLFHERRIKCCFNSEQPCVLLYRFFLNINSTILLPDFQMLADVNRVSHVFLRQPYLTLIRNVINWTIVSASNFCFFWLIEIIFVFTFDINLQLMFCLRWISNEHRYSEEYFFS